MDEMDEKAVVRVDADGNAVKCAKGLAQGCGYKAGAKVCGKCGAMAVQVKKVKPVMDDEEMDDDEEKYMGTPRMRRKGGVDMTEDYDGMGDEMPKKPKAKRGSAMRNPDELDEYDEEDPSAEEMDESGDAPDESNAEMGETPVEAMNMRDRKRRMMARRRRMASMGQKSENWDDDAFLCGFERKMLPGGSGVCAHCPGGCAPEADLPTLLEVEGFAEAELAGKVLNSGYADVTDEFIVDVERKDGRVVEARFDGVSGEMLGWHTLDDELIGAKSAQHPLAIISISQAAEIATKNLPGDVVNVGADVVDDVEVYAVEIEGVDGKSYDGFVTLDGEFYGYDEYDVEDAAEVDAEVAELALKAMYTEDQRMEMADEGNALPDGSYPIANVEDLKNAIQAYGRAKDKGKAKQHIMKRARQLDAMDMIPESWTEEKEADAVGGDTEFLASLMEFELLATEDDLDQMG